MSTPDLDAARERLRRLEHLETLHSAAVWQLGKMTETIVELEGRYAAEQADVVELEKPGLASIMLRLSGRRDDRLAQERAEAEVARVRLESHRRRYAELREDNEQRAEEIAALSGARASYAAAQPASSVPAADIAEQLAGTRARLTECREALNAGNAALAAIDAVVTSLNGAESWSTVDTFTDGWLADVAEQEHMETARVQAERAQTLIDAFVRELRDVEAAGFAVADIDTRWFVDLFFDNFITDMIRHERITGAQNQMLNVRTKVHAQVLRLQSEGRRLTTELTVLEGRAGVVL